jgi:hypothetical protein
VQRSALIVRICRDRRLTNRILRSQLTMPVSSPWVCYSRGTMSISRQSIPAGAVLLLVFPMIGKISAANWAACTLPATLGALDGTDRVRCLTSPPAIASSAAFGDHRPRMIANKDSGSNLAVVRGHHMGDAPAFGEPIIELDGVSCGKSSQGSQRLGRRVALAARPMQPGPSFYPAGIKID